LSQSGLWTAHLLSEIAITFAPASIAIFAKVSQAFPAHCTTIDFPDIESFLSARYCSNT